MIPTFATLRTPRFPSPLPLRCCYPPIAILAQNVHRNFKCLKHFGALAACPRNQF